MGGGSGGGGGGRDGMGWDDGAHAMALMDGMGCCWRWWWLMVVAVAMAATFMDRGATAAACLYENGPISRTERTCGHPSVDLPTLARSPSVIAAMELAGPGSRGAPHLGPFGGV